MNKAQLVDAIAVAADISKMAATKALDTLIESVTASLNAGESVTIAGFGNFVVKHRAARTGRNPRTGESIQIKASAVPGFKPAKAFKEAVQPKE